MPALKYALIALAALLVVAIGVGTYMYFDVSNQLSPPEIDRQAVAAVLDAPPESNESTDTATYILLLGNDRRENQGWTRSDTIILARLDAETNSVSMVSIPRDTRVDVPGYGTTKINHSSAYGGPALAIETVKQFTGLPIHHYVEVDFEGFEQIVDAVGGVRVNVQVPVGSVSAGLQTLNGEDALAWVRDRHGYASGDFARMKNQQTFLLALAKQVSKSDNFAKLPSILNATSKHIKTDMSVPKLMSMASDYRGLDSSTLRTASVPGKTATINGVSYVLADKAATVAMFADLADGGFDETP
ncbi:MAG: LCP family protein [Actinomycetota bacterium]|nr:LCP family protein [Actinomycetota bacterium]